MSLGSSDWCTKSIFRKHAGVSSFIASRAWVQNKLMIYGYARVSTDGQSVAAQVAARRKHGAGKVFREVAGGIKTDRTQLRRC
jgi:Resolvase, N terminal domain